MVKNIQMLKKSKDNSQARKSSSKLANKTISKQKSPNTTTRKKRRPNKVNMVVGRKLFRVSCKVLREIKHFQTSVKSLVPKLPFSRLIQEIIQEFAPLGLKIQKEALLALQESAECYLTQYFEDSYACTLHARRITLIPRDMSLVQFLRKSI